MDKPLQQYTNIKDSSTYANGNIIYINIEDQYILLNSKGDQILNLSYCENKIIIQTPVDLDDNSIMLYEYYDENLCLFRVFYL